jgi:hypothetical protein
MLEAGSVLIADVSGDHARTAARIAGTTAGRSFVRFAELLSMAVIKSVFLQTISRVQRNRKRAYWLVYSNPMTASSSCCPSASSLTADMKGWFAGQDEILGSFLFWSCGKGYRAS